MMSLPTRTFIGVVAHGIVRVILNRNPAALGRPPAPPPPAPPAPGGK
jgi:hypothetical protein